MALADEARYFIDHVFGSLTPPLISFVQDAVDALLLFLALPNLDLLRLLVILVLMVVLRFLRFTFRHELVLLV